ncbi:SMP-30/gluconolactonase/LRE family protein [Saccharopolyspora hirsuta]|uniref:SMP-30/gluconolactonase/LRE family protein n=1 Tax=Saccharopolyspora hirsuta TaxID=1837 RepID=A0A5M7CFP6_SACHI|nr:SMP-30/gluconolactonase/LRE family protein [Saccharopolyspora hirsuta]KAA5837285.1 SMP-30/gluconolactonase/LRE family protein [Saccharopolyspora hirsuta]
MQVDSAVPAAARSGRAPTWDVGTDTLLWADPPTRSAHRFVPGRTDHAMELPQQVSAAKPRSLGGLALHLTEGIALFDSTGSHRTWLVYWAREGVQAGATAIDAKGRLWATTLGEGGWLARVTGDGKASIALKDLPAGNGIAWSPDNTRLYLADGATRRIDVLDFDLDSGALGDRRALCEVDGEPGGLCVDAEGSIWVAVRDRGEIRSYTAEGALDRTIPLPAQRPTDCCFGGPDLTHLYITSATDEVPEPTETDGSVLIIRNLGTGLRPCSFAG